MMNIASEKQPIYKAESDKLRAEAVGRDLEGKILLLQDVESRGRVNMQDTDAVKEVAADYMERCRAGGLVPTVMGLSASLGVSRQWLNRFCNENPSHPTTRFIEVLKEVFADCLTQAGFGRYISESLSIFILKNTASMADKVELEAVASNTPLGESVTQQQLEERIAGSVVLDDDDY